MTWKFIKFSALGAKTGMAKKYAVKEMGKDDNCCEAVAQRRWNRRVCGWPVN